MGVTPIAARESVVKYQMNIKEDQFTEIKHFVVYCATWNVNGQNPNGPLLDWLSPPDEDPPDLYAVGFQELDLSKEAFVFNESPKEDLWRSVVTLGLSKKAKYKQVSGQTKIEVEGWMRSTEVAFLFPAQQPRVQIPTQSKNFSLLFSL